LNTQSISKFRKSKSNEDMLASLKMAQAKSNQQKSLFAERNEMK